MKWSSLFPCLRHGLAASVFILIALPVWADQFKANNNSSLELGGSWVSGVAPTASDNAIWDATITVPTNATNSLGNAVTWGGIVLSNPVAPVYISGNTTLTLNNGINLANASVNLTVDCTALNLGGNQTWTVLFRAGVDDGRFRPAGLGQFTQ